MDNIRFLCPRCRRVLEADKSFAGMTCRCPGCQLEVIVPSQPGAPPPPNVPPPSNVPPRGPYVDPARRQLQTAFNLFLWFTIVALVCSFIGGIVSFLMDGIGSFRGLVSSGGVDTDELIRQAVTYASVMALCMAPGWIFGLAALIFKCIFLFRCWDLVPPERAATTPGKAVGFLFIPLFSLYWNFVAFYELGVFLETASGDRQPRQLAQAFSIISILALVLCCCNNLLGLVLMVLEILMLSSFLTAIKRWKQWV